MSLRNRISLRNTLAFRLTLWYAGIFTASSCVAFILFYMLINFFISGKMDQELLSQVNRFSTLLVAEGVESMKGAAVIEAQSAPHPIWPTGRILPFTRRRSENCSGQGLPSMRP